MKNKNFCVALYHPYKNDINGKFDEIQFQLECTKEGLSKLKSDDDLGYIELVGWLPIEYYKGEEQINEFNDKFIRW
jgi:hypothetical protein